MKFRLLSFAAALYLSIALSAVPGIAQAQELKPEPELVRQMLQDGWTKVEEGVLQRTEWGPVETFTYGEDGLRWTARGLEARLEFLGKEYASNPTEELAGILESLSSQLIEIDEAMASGSAGAEVVSPDELADCLVLNPYPVTAAAGPETGPSAPGTKANATAYFHSNCGEIGHTYAYAYARATAGTVTTVKIQEDPKYDTSWGDSAASASAPGSLDCYSEAYARAWNSALTINYVTEPPPTNYSCSPTSPVIASINGLSDVWLNSSHTCETVTWTASATGGSGAYTYKWYLGTGTVVVGTGSSWSRTYCRTNKRVDLRVVATDTSSPAKTDDATFTTWIHY